MEKRKIAISDIHGCRKTFEALLEKIHFSKQDELYLLGDYIDRGADSKGVIDCIWKLQEEGYTVHCLRGNHEQLMLEAAFFENKVGLWIRNGGDTTLQSFGITDIKDIPRKYITWLRQLPFYFLVDNYILVHAGLNFQKPSPLSERYDMIWIRRWYEHLDRDWLGEAIILHGHTTTQKEIIEDMLQHLDTTPVLVIDNGCVFAKSTDKGRLCAFDMGSKQLFFQKNIE